MLTYRDHAVRTYHVPCGVKTSWQLIVPLSIGEVAVGHKEPIVFFIIILTVTITITLLLTLDRWRDSVCVCVCVCVCVDSYKERVKE